MKRICINCAPLIGNITGIERYIYENIKRIDGLAEKENADIVLLYPKGTKPNFPPLKYLKKVPLESRGNKIRISAIKRYMKEQDAFYFSLHGGICFTTKAVMCTCDIRTWLHKEYDPLKFRLKCNINAITSKLFAARIVTISQTSRKEISECLNIDINKIDIIYPGWEHILEVKPDNNIWGKIPTVRKGSYYYSLSSRAPHKNFKWVEEMAKRNPEDIFIVGGKKWISEDTKCIPSNMHYLGYVSDAENVELMKNCKAFLHPAKYEGFGMTPLEALVCGAKVCMSNASCLPEIFEDCVHYFDPDDYYVDLEMLLSESVASAEKLFEKYSWNKSAEQWFNLMMQYSIL